MEHSAAVLERLIGLHPKVMDLSLGRLERLLGLLDHPERNAPPVIHVAGTNGKGSTIAYMRAVLEASGRTAHVYSSPHLVRFHERVRLGAPGGGQFVDESVLVDALSTCERVNGGEQITYFEITTAAAFLLFAEHPADFLLLETGLGGRVDATNVIDHPELTVITPISFDHEHFLGDTLASIATEKAGIMKPGVPVVVSPQQDEAFEVLETRANSLGAPVFAGGRDWMSWEEQGRLVFQDEEGLLDLPVPRLFGRHQVINAGTAIAALRRLRVAVNDAELAAGIVNADWPGRMQMLTGKITELAPEGAEIWVDGGHNPDGGRVVAAAIADLEDRVPRPLVLIVGMLNSKAADRFLSNFIDLASMAHMVPIERQESSFEPADLAAIASDVGLKAQPAASLEDAFERIGAEDWPIAPRILICGSLYLAGEVLEKDGTLPA